MRRTNRKVPTKSKVTWSNLPTLQEARVQSLGQEDFLEKEMATHSSILAWKIPWTEEPGRLQSMESLRVGHGLVTISCLHQVQSSKNQENRWCEF